MINWAQLVELFISFLDVKLVTGSEQTPSTADQAGSLLVYLP